MATRTPTHLYEIRLDGSGLRQITDHPYWSDFEPTYLRRRTHRLRLGPIGAQQRVRQVLGRPHGDQPLRVRARRPGTARLSDNKDIDRYPHSSTTACIAYTRWEYQERHFLEVHAIWTVRPDGTMADAVFNQHLRAPYGLRDTRAFRAARGWCRSPRATTRWPTGRSW